jgi:ubiquinone/menaquinone biosynthesis C-methylase UbiE
MTTAESPNTVASPDKIESANVFHLDWLNEDERKFASDFEKRAGLDYKRTLAAIAAAAELQAGMRVLDVATGTGVLARQLCLRVGEKGCVVAVDAENSVIGKASLAAQTAGLGRKIEWRLAPAESLPFGKGEFDLVTCTMKFPKLQAPRFINEAYRVLKESGHLLVATEMAPRTSFGNIQLRIRRSYFQYIARDPAEASAQFYSSDQLLAMLNQAGFRQTIIRSLPQKHRHATTFAVIRAAK